MQLAGGRGAVVASRGPVPPVDAPSGAFPCRADATSGVIRATDDGVPVVPDASAGLPPGLHPAHRRAGGGPARAVRQKLRRAVRHRSLPCEDRCRTARAAMIRAPRTGADPGRAGPVVDAAAIRRGPFSTVPSRERARTLTTGSLLRRRMTANVHQEWSPSAGPVSCPGGPGCCAAATGSCQLGVPKRRFRSRDDGVSTGQPAKVSFPVRMSKCGGRRGWSLEFRLRGTYSLR